MKHVSNAAPEGVLFEVLTTVRLSERRFEAARSYCCPLARLWGAAGLLILPIIILPAAGFLLTGCGFGSGSAEGVGIQNVSQAAPRLQDHNDAGDYTPYYATGDLNRPRYLHESIILQSGQPVAMGGSDERGFSGIDNVEIFDQSTFAKDVPRPASLAGLWVDTNFEGDPISFDNGSRMYFTADLLADGRVLVTGGSADLLGGEIRGTAELFDPQTRKFSSVDEKMVKPRFRHVSIPQNDGSILFIGGQIQSSVTVILPTVQQGGVRSQIQVTVFNSTSESEFFSPTESKFLLLTLPGSDTPVKLNSPRGRSGHAVAKMAGPDNVLNSSDDVMVITGGIQTLTGQFSPANKLPGDVAAGVADGLTSIEFFDPQTSIFTQVSNVSLSTSRVNKPYIVNLGQFNDFTPDGVQGMGNMVLITHGNSDGTCPVTPLVDELLVANFTGFGPAQGLQFFAVEDATNNGHVQGIEYRRPPDFVGRCGTNPVGLPRRLITAPGVGDVETWVFSLAGVDIFLSPAGVCVENTISPTMRAGCVFDPFYSLAATDLGLPPRDLQSQRSKNNPLGVVGTWLTLDGQIPTTDRSLFGNTQSRSRWGHMVAAARIWHRCIPLAGVDGVLNTADDRILLAGGGTSYGVAMIDLGGEPTAPSAEIFLPPNVNSEKPSP